MTKEQLTNNLRKLGWSQADFAKKTGVHRNAVNRWCTGKAKVPKVVDMYFELAFRFLKIKDMVEL